MIRPLDFYDTYVHAETKEIQAKAIIQLFADNIENLAKKKDLENFRLSINHDFESARKETNHMGEGLETQIRYLDQKIDLQISNLSKSISSLSNVMYGGFAVIFVALGYLIFKI